jgi:hypothetical protein
MSSGLDFGDLQKDLLVEQAAAVGFTLTRKDFEKADMLAQILNEFIEAPQ